MISGVVMMDKHELYVHIMMDKHDTYVLFIVLQ